MATRAAEKQYFLTAAEVHERYGIDVITAETLRSGFIEASRHMRDTLMRSAFSNVVRENLDMGTSIHLIAEQGTEMVAITEGACHFAFTHPHMVNLVIDEWGLENLGPGDTLICNDNWRGAIHFPDVNLFRPMFWEGEPLFILSDASHIVDIGGPVPGGFNNQAKTYYEEGLRIPPMLITSGDVPVRSTINLLVENTRTPLHNLGDIRALFGTMKVGEERLRRMLERFGTEAVKAAARYTLDLAERRMRRAIDEIPDGDYEAEEVLDDDGVTGKPVHIRASARVAGDHVEIDYSGSDRQTVGATVTCWEETNRCLIGAKLVLDRRHPMNTGAMRPFHVIAPPGSVVMGLPPTSASNHPEIATKISALFVELFGKMMPAQAVATESGTTHIHIIGGVDERPGRRGLPFGGVITGGPAWGGTPENDGISFNVTPIFNVQDNVLELLERDNPIVLRNRNLVIDAAGPGRHRSGYSACFVLECLDGQSEISFSALLDSGRFHRTGMHGGGFGMTSYIFKVKRRPDRVIRELNGVIPLEDLVPLAGLFDAEGRPHPVDGEWYTTPEVPTLKIANYVLREGEALYVVCATGGGYGDPLERDVDDVALDVWNDKVTLRLAAEVYGVVMGDDGRNADRQATAQLRERLRAQRAPSDVPVGMLEPWPQTWEEWQQRCALGAGGGA